MRNWQGEFCRTAFYLHPGGGIQLGPYSARLTKWNRALASTQLAKAPKHNINFAPVAETWLGAPGAGNARRSYANFLAKTYGAATIGWLALLGTAIETITEREAVGWMAVLLLLFTGISLSLRNLDLVKKRTHLIFAASSSFRMYP